MILAIIVFPLGANANKAIPGTDTSHCSNWPSYTQVYLPVRPRGMNSEGALTAGSGFTEGAEIVAAYTKIKQGVI